MALSMVVKMELLTVVVLVVLLAERKVARKEYRKDNEMAYMMVEQKA